MIRQLRREAPRWHWRALRHGMGWQYEGRRLGHRAVLVQSEGVLVGEDDVATRWMADDGDARVSLAMWLLREASKDVSAAGAKEE